MMRRRTRNQTSTAVSDPVSARDTQQSRQYLAERSRILFSRRAHKLWADAPHHETPQFRDLRYTGCLVPNPIDFEAEKYSLLVHQEDEGAVRQESGSSVSQNRGRRVKLMVCVTLYNEGPDELEITMMSICRNVRTLCDRWGDEAWKEFVLCFVADGRSKLDDATLRLAARWGIYDSDIMGVQHGNARAHIFESTPQLVDSATRSESYFPPVQTLFVIKEENAGKLDSHRWFFNAFAAHVEPTYTFLLDCGTSPQDDAFFCLCERMDGDERIAGICGEIEPVGVPTLEVIVAAQSFEYQMANFLQKSLESLFGFISVLPGAFSGYRFEAIFSRHEECPLTMYFKSITTPTSELGPFEANMFLAEDRVLCFEIVASPNQRWLLHYEKGVKAFTDVPPDLHALIKQRRRWLNGSFFATLYTLSSLHRLWKLSGHSFLRKLSISGLFAVHLAMLILNWFMVANFLILFRSLMPSALSQTSLGEDAQQTYVSIFTTIYLVLMLIQIPFAVGTRPDDAAVVYYGCAVFYGSASLFAVVAVLTTAFEGFSHVVLMGLVCMAVWFVAAFEHNAGLKLVTTFVQYLFFLPSFLCLFTIYSLCNVHDLSWGTKGLDSGTTLDRAIADSTAETQNYFQQFRTQLVFFYVLTNGLLIVATSQSQLLADWYLTLFLWFTIVLFGVQLFGSTVFVTKYWCEKLRKHCCRAIQRAKPSSKHASGTFITRKRGGKVARVSSQIINVGFWILFVWLIVSALGHGSGSMPAQAPDVSDFCDSVGIPSNSTDSSNGWFPRHFPFNLAGSHAMQINQAPTDQDLQQLGLKTVWFGTQLFLCKSKSVRGDKGEYPSVSFSDETVRLCNNESQEDSAWKQLYQRTIMGTNYGGTHPLWDGYSGSYFGGGGGEFGGNNYARETLSKNWSTMQQWFNNSGVTQSSLSGSWCQRVVSAYNFDTASGKYATRSRPKPNVTTNCLPGISKCTPLAEDDPPLSGGITGVQTWSFEPQLNQATVVNVSVEVPAHCTASTVFLSRALVPEDLGWGNVSQTQETQLSCLSYAGILSRTPARHTDGTALQTYLDPSSTSPGSQSGSPTISGYERWCEDAPVGQAMKCGQKYSCVNTTSMKTDKYCPHTGTSEGRCCPTWLPMCTPVPDTVLWSTSAPRLTQPVQPLKPQTCKFVFANRLGATNSRKKIVPQSNPNNVTESWLTPPRYESGTCNPTVVVAFTNASNQSAAFLPQKVLQLKDGKRYVCRKECPSPSATAILQCKKYGDIIHGCSCVATEDTTDKLTNVTVRYNDVWLNGSTCCGIKNIPFYVAPGFNQSCSSSWSFPAAYNESDAGIIVSGVETQVEQGGVDVSSNCLYERPNGPITSCARNGGRGRAQTKTACDALAGGNARCSAKSFSHSWRSTAPVVTVAVSWKCAKPRNVKTQGLMEPADIASFAPKISLNYTFEYNPSWADVFLNAKHYFAFWTVIFGLGMAAGFAGVHRLRNHKAQTTRIPDRARGMFLPSSILLSLPLLSMVADCIDFVAITAAFYVMNPSHSKEFDIVVRLLVPVCPILIVCVRFAFAAVEVRKSKRGDIKRDHKLSIVIWSLVAIVLIIVLPRVAPKETAHALESVAKVLMFARKVDFYFMFGCAACIAAVALVLPENNRVCLWFKELAFGPMFFGVVFQLVNAFRCICWTQTYCPDNSVQPPLVYFDTNEVCMGGSQQLAVQVSLTLLIPYYIIAAQRALQSQINQTIIVWDADTIVAYHHLKFAVYVCAGVSPVEYFPYLTMPLLWFVCLYMALNASFYKPCNIEFVNFVVGYCFALTLGAASVVMLGHWKVTETDLEYLMTAWAIAATVIMAIAYRHSFSWNVRTFKERVWHGSSHDSTALRSTVFYQDMKYIVGRAKKTQKADIVVIGNRSRPLNRHVAALMLDHREHVTSATSSRLSDFDMPRTFLSCIHELNISGVELTTKASALMFKALSRSSVVVFKRTHPVLHEKEFKAVLDLLRADHCNLEALHVSTAEEHDVEMAAAVIQCAVLESFNGVPFRSFLRSTQPPADAKFADCGEAGSLVLLHVFEELEKKGMGIFSLNGISVRQTALDLRARDPPLREYEKRFLAWHLLNTHDQNMKIAHLNGLRTEIEASSSLARSQVADYSRRFTDDYEVSFVARLLSSKKLSLRQLVLHADAPLELASFTGPTVAFPSAYLRDVDCIVFSQFLGQQSCRIASLDLSSNAISNRGVEVLCHGLKRNVSVSSLKLSNNAVGDAGATHIAHMLRFNRKLKALHVDQNSIKVAGATAIARAIISPGCALQTLQVGQPTLNLKLLKGVGSSGTDIHNIVLCRQKASVLDAICACKCIGVNRMCTALDMSDNEFEDECVPVLLELFKANNILQTVDLSYNRLGLRDHDELLGFVTKSHLKQLNLDANLIDGHTLQRMYASFEASSLQKLSARFNLAYVGTASIMTRSPASASNSTARVRSSAISPAHGHGIGSSEPMLYTQVLTHHPNTFVSDGYTLRYAHGVDILAAIVVEPSDSVKDLSASIQGFCKSIHHYRSQWERVALCIIIDGFEGTQDVLKFVQEMEMYDHSKLERSGRANFHLFEHTCQIPADRNFKHTYPPLQSTVAVSATPIGRDRATKWFLHAFARSIRPKYLVLCRPGVAIRANGLSKVERAFEAHPQAVGINGMVTTHVRLGSIASKAWKFASVLQESYDKVPLLTMLNPDLCAIRWREIVNDITAVEQRASNDNALNLDVLVSFSWSLLCARDSGFIHLQHSWEADRKVDSQQTTELIGHFSQEFVIRASALLSEVSKRAELFRSTPSIARRGAFVLNFAVKICRLAFSWFSAANLIMFMMLMSQSVPAAILGGHHWCTDGIHGGADANVPCAEEFEYQSSFGFNIWQPTNRLQPWSTPLNSESVCPVLRAKFNDQETCPCCLPKGSEALTYFKYSSCSGILKNDASVNKICSASTFGQNTCGGDTGGGMMPLGAICTGYYGSPQILNYWIPEHPHFNETQVFNFAENNNVTLELNYSEYVVNASRTVDLYSLWTHNVGSYIQQLDETLQDLAQKYKGTPYKLEQINDVKSSITRVPPFPDVPNGWCRTQAALPTCYDAKSIETAWKQFGAAVPCTGPLGAWFNFAFLTALLIQIVASMGNRLNRSSDIFTLITLFYVVCMVAIFVTTCVMGYPDDSGDAHVIYPLVGYVVLSMVACAFIRDGLGTAILFVVYVFVCPVFSVVATLHGVCNCNQALQNSDRMRRDSDARTNVVRTIIVACYLVSNLFLYLVTPIHGYRAYFAVLLIVLCIFNAVSAAQWMYSRTVQKASRDSIWRAQLSTATPLFTKERSAPRAAGAPFWWVFVQATELLFIVFAMISPSWAFVNGTHVAPFHAGCQSDDWLQQANATRASLVSTESCACIRDERYAQFVGICGNVDYASDQTTAPPAFCGNAGFNVSAPLQLWQCSAFPRLQLGTASPLPWYTKLNCTVPFSMQQCQGLQFLCGDVIQAVKVLLIMATACLGLQMFIVSLYAAASHKVTLRAREILSTCACALGITSLLACAAVAILWATAIHKVTNADEEQRQDPNDTVWSAPYVLCCLTTLMCFYSLSAFIDDRTFTRNKMASMYHHGGHETSETGIEMNERGSHVTNPVLSALSLDSPSAIPASDTDALAED